MAQVSAAKLPNFGTMSSVQRAQWFLEQLRGQEGTIVEHEGGRWLQLVHDGTIIDVMYQIAPGLTQEQYKATSRTLGAEKDRISTNAGGGRYVHLIRLEGTDQATPSIVAPVGIDPAEVDRVCRILQEVAERLRTQEHMLAARDEEYARTLAEMEAELIRLRKENELLRQSAAGVNVFFDGVAALESALRQK